MIDLSGVDSNHIRRWDIWHFLNYGLLIFLGPYIIKGHLESKVTRDDF